MTEHNAGAPTWPAVPGRAYRWTATAIGTLADAAKAGSVMFLGVVAYQAFHHHPDDVPFLLWPDGRYVVACVALAVLGLVLGTVFGRMTRPARLKTGQHRIVVDYEAGELHSDWWVPAAEMAEAIASTVRAVPGARYEIVVNDPDGEDYRACSPQTIGPATLTGRWAEGGK